GSQGPAGRDGPQGAQGLGRAGGPGHAPRAPAARGGAGGGRGPAAVGAAGFRRIQGAQPHPVGHLQGRVSAVSKSPGLRSHGRGQDQHRHAGRAPAGGLPPAGQGGREGRGKGPPAHRQGGLSDRVRGSNEGPGRRGHGHLFQAPGAAGPERPRADGRHAAVAAGAVRDDHDRDDAREVGRDNAQGRGVGRGGGRQAAHHRRSAPPQRRARSGDRNPGRPHRPSCRGLPEPRAHRGPQRDAAQLPGRGLLSGREPRHGPVLFR
ncbi:hypothetical protein H632_c4583p0, partial [Helicosporidium sp. ATCC 50920]